MHSQKEQQHLPFPQRTQLHGPQTAQQSSGLLLSNPQTLGQIGGNSTQMFTPSSAIPPNLPSSSGLQGRTFSSLSQQPSPPAPPLPSQQKLQPQQPSNTTSLLLPQPPVKRLATSLPKSPNLPVPAPMYLTTPSGDTYPSELAPYLSRGTPIKLLSPPHDKAVLKCIAGRFPEGMSLADLASPIIVNRDSSNANQDEDISPMFGEDGGGSTGFRKKFTPAPRVTRKVDSMSLPWKLSDGSHKHLVGRKLPLDTSSYFIMRQRNNVVELIPLDAWHAFQADVPPLAIEGAITSDLAERKRRAALRKEEWRNVAILNRVNKEVAVTEPAASTVTVTDNVKDESVVDDVYAEDAGLSNQQKRRLKHFIKSKKKTFLKEDEGVGDSALNMREVKRAEVDWDWDDDGKASDDEEDAEDLLGEASDYQKNDYLESDEEDKEILTKFGQKVSSALETQKEQDAVDELAQFSDDEEEIEEKEKDSTSGRASGSSSVVGNITNEPEREKLEPSLAGSRQDGKKSKTKKTAPRKVGDEEIKSPEALKQKVIRVLSLQGGRMPTKDFVEQFNITDRKSELFKMTRKVLNEICEVYTGTRNGVPIKLIELQAQFRQTC